MTRIAHLVGSIPAADADEAMDLAVSRLGSRLRYLPDGETGPRFHWIVGIIEGLRTHPDLEIAKDGDWSDYDKTPRFKVKRGHKLTGDALDFGYHKAFEESWPAFKEHRAAANGSGELSFQVGIPGDLDMALFVFGPLGAFLKRRAFTEATLRDVRAIHAEAGTDVVFQVEIPVELIFVAKMPGSLQGPMASFLARGVGRLVEQAPAGTRWGIHLCLGDMNHRALGRMKDAMPVVHLANAIAKRWPSGRSLEFMHFPLAAALEPPSTDPGFYAPLSRLRLGPDTRLIAGFAHEGQDMAEQRRLREIIDRAVGSPVDISCSCGLGRRKQEEAIAAMERTAALASD
jgi:hypothetical protein